MTAIPFDAHMEAPRDRARLQAPSRFLWLLEGRAFYEFGLSITSWPLLARAPRGDGHAVLVLPGFLASDASTRPLRAYLSRLGYDARPWDLGRNVGGVGLRRALTDRIEELVRETGRPVSLIGWSLGGVYARDLAARRPYAVRSVITLGSPLSGDAEASNVSEIYDRVAGAEPRAANAAIFGHMREPLAMPATSIYTKSDGIVDWHACLIDRNARSENLEVIGASHVGLGVNPAVYWAIADRLAQPEGLFTAFARNGPFALAYGRERTA